MAADTITMESPLSPSSEASDRPVPVAERRFRAMGSDAHLIVVGAAVGPDPEQLLAVAVDRIEELEQRWSRFRPDSEVSQLTRHAGHPVTVSADTVLLVERAVEAWRLTGGSFDPTVLAAMQRAGYDRSFSELPADRPADVPSLAATPGSTPVSALVGCTDITVHGHDVCLPAGTGFDGGGIGKGLAADLVAAELLAAGAAGVCVNLGGDLLVDGVGPDGGTWTVGLEHPWQAEPFALVGLLRGAVATSTTLRRTWRVGGQRRHHLIDPYTGEPSLTDLGLVSVIHGDAWMAEVLAKAILLRGSDRAFDLIDVDQIAVVTVALDGRVVATPAAAAYLGGAAMPSRLSEPPSKEVV